MAKQITAFILKISNQLSARVDVRKNLNSLLVAAGPRKYNKTKKNQFKPKQNKQKLKPKQQ